MPQTAVGNVSQRLFWQRFQDAEAGGLNRPSPTFFGVQRWGAHLNPFSLLAPEFFRLDSVMPRIPLWLNCR